MSRTGAPTLVVVNPSPDLYGADLQMLQAVRAAIGHGWRVTVVLPSDGPLVERIHETGADVTLTDYPVLRKANLRPDALLRMVVAAVASMPRSVRLIRRLRADVVCVNTATLPWWLLAGRLAGRPVVGYLHEAETAGSKLVRAALMVPFLLAQRMVLISDAARAAMLDVTPWLDGRAVQVYNGVPGPSEDLEPADLPAAGPVRLAVVGRLSPRKGTDVALRAVERLRDRGIDARLEVAGTAFAGYEWFTDELHAIAARPQMAGAVDFSGYCSPVWPVLERAHVVLAPSLNEPFGNAVVEAQLSGRVVVAAAAQGHLESVSDGETGLLVAPGDDAAMADAVVALLADRDRAATIGAYASAEARRRFGVERYGREIVGVLESLRESAA